MKPTRREWLSFTGLGSILAVAMRHRMAAQDAAPDHIVSRIASIIREYDAQGFHRTATATDHASGDWLADQVRQTGLRPALEPFPVSRVDPVACAVTVANRRVEGIPLFDARFTSAAGVLGRLGVLNSGAEVGLTETGVNAAATGALGAARRANSHQAIVAITRGRRPGLCPSNADAFLSPFGPPVLQVSSDDAGWLTDAAARGADVQVVAQVARVAASANNVTAELPGADPALPPLVVMTPRSGWYRCASERGGGIASWLEIMRGLQAAPLKRRVMFVASSGHELGHLGIDAYIARRPGVVEHAVAWLHLGANIGAATDLTNNLLQASNDELDATLAEGMRSVGLEVARRAPRDRVPAGEAEAVHRGGGRYVSAIGGNALFHNIADRGPEATDPPSIARFSAAFIAAARALDGSA